MRAIHLMATALLCSMTSNTATAAIRTFQKLYPSIAAVQIQQGHAPCGSIDNELVEKGAINDKYDKTWNDAGTHGKKICWRRSDPPDVQGGWTTWIQCIQDGDCEIN
jgi:hypothetical protein